MKRYNLGLVAILATGCATVDPFERSDEALMSQVMEEARISKDLDSWIKNAGKSSVVFINMEDNNYTDDQLPEYMLLDHMYTKIKDGNNSIRILERDPDVLSVFQKEIDGVELPATSKSGGSMDSLSIEERRAELGAMLRSVVTDISPQDVLVTLDECCKDGEGAGTTEEILANEVGGKKSDLLKWLIREYYDLYPEVTASKRHVDVENADYLIAYRVYDYGAWKSSKLLVTDRITYVKLHVRVIDVKTGEVVVADFMDNRKEDRLTRRENLALAKTSASQADYGRPSARSSKSGTDAAPKRAPSSFSSSSSSSSEKGFGKLLRKLKFWK